LVYFWSSDKFYGHLVYFWSSDKFYCHLVYFFLFWYVVRGKNLAPVPFDAKCQWSLYVVHKHK
jgi:hypothetical protein